MQVAGVRAHHPQRHAGLDAPLPIGHGQTNSQPSTVRTMLELLDVQPGDRVLDVGAGSGWTTAILARLTGPTGSGKTLSAFLWAIDRLAALPEVESATGTVATATPDQLPDDEQFAISQIVFDRDSALPHRRSR